MSEFLVLFLFPKPPTQSKDDGEALEEAKEDPLVRAAIAEMTTWIEAELKAQRLTSGGVLTESTAETDVRVNFHNPDEPAKETAEEGTISLPPSKSSVVRGPQANVSAAISYYYVVKFPTIEDVVAWAQSCPISCDGFALEIRKLQSSAEILGEVDGETSDHIGDLVVSQRKKAMEEGKMKKEEDGTLWAKVEASDEKIEEVIKKAEERIEAEETQ